MSNVEKVNVILDLNLTEMIGHRYSTLDKDLTFSASLINHSEYYGVLTNAMIKKLSNKLKDINCIVSDISILGLIPSILEHSDTSTILNVILPLRTISNTHVKYKSIITDTDILTRGLFDDKDNIEPIDNLYMIGLGGFNSNLLYNLLVFIAIYYSLNDMFNRNDIDKIRSILGQVIVSSDEDIENIKDDSKLNTIIEQKFEQMKKMYELLIKMFGNSTLYIYEPDNVEFSNTLRFPYMSLSPIGQPKLVYFKDMLKALKDVGLFKDIKVGINRVTEDHFDKIDVIMSNSNSYITGAVSPRFRLALTKRFNDRFIFLGHFDNDYIVSNDHSQIINLSEEDIFVSESYGNINLGTFICNMYAATFDFIRVLKSNKPVTIERNFKDIINVKNTMLIDHNIKDGMKLVVSDKNEFAKDIDDIARNNLSEKESKIYTKQFKNKCEILPEDEYRLVCAQDTSGLNRPTVKYILSNPILSKDGFGNISAYVVGYIY